MLGKRERKSKLGKYLVVGGAVAAVAYFFDPRMGRTRRKRLQDQLAGKARRGAREVERRAEYTRGQIESLKNVGTGDSAPPSDAALTAKVESEVLSRWNYPKGFIVVNSADGIVELRGTCETTEQINELEAQVRKVTGVLDVHNYLHLPNTPAPNKQDARRTT